VIHGNFLDVDLSPADVVTYIWLPMPRDAAPESRKVLKNGARVVSHDFAVPGWKAKLVIKIPTFTAHHLSVPDAAQKK